LPGQSLARWFKSPAGSEGTRPLFTNPFRGVVTVA
jgi:hypothetical protein